MHPRDIVGERRRQADRRVTPVEALPDPPVLERRSKIDRRTTPTRERLTLLPAPWQDGWIVFEQVDGGREARRLAPIPTEWTRCSEAELARLLRDATLARGHGHVS